ncbi:MAG: TlpA disulfide reductase family protein [Steroidobacteraceae bacterium]|jgi:thiol-disulfide isomerase/thioredoxin
MSGRGWILGALLIYSGGYGQNVPDPTLRGEVLIGESLREATLQGLNGPNRALSEFRGRPLVINVWASWCGPCRQEMKSLDRLAWRAGRPDFSIIGISTDDDAEEARRLLLETHVTISEFIDTALRMERMLGASRLPLTVFVAPDGRVLEKIYGAREWDGPEALQLIDSAFGKGSRAVH